MAEPPDETEGAETGDTIYECALAEVLAEGIAEDVRGEAPAAEIHGHARSSCRGVPAAPADGAGAAQPHAAGGRRRAPARRAPQPLSLIHI